MKELYNKSHGYTPWQQAHWLARRKHSPFNVTESFGDACQNPPPCDFGNICGTLPAWSQVCLALGPLSLRSTQPSLLVALFVKLRLP
eukprot:1157967-Pelagomonas_calceolata.AAC.1